MTKNRSNNSNSTRDELVQKWRASLLPWEYATNQAFTWSKNVHDNNATQGTNTTSITTGSHFQNARPFRLKFRNGSSRISKKRKLPLPHQNQKSILATTSTATPITVNQTVFKFVLFDTLYQFIVALWSLKTFFESQRPGNIFRPRVPKQHYSFEIWNDRYQKDIMAYDRALLPTEAIRTKLDHHVQAIQRRQRKYVERNNKPHRGKNHFLQQRRHEQNTTIVLELKTPEQFSALPDLVSFLLTAFHHKRTVQQLLGNDVEILILLESPGGNVATYGYLASQLARLRSNRNTTNTNNTTSTTIEEGTSKVAGIGTKLTICCDTVAASGGYLMACQADWFMAAPFAVIGSIGVYKVGSNFREFLEKFGIRPLLISSGKYKTLWHEYANNPPTKEELQHLQSKEDATLDAFKREILSIRSTRITNMERLATGEAWLGVDAIKLGLVDELKTSDEYVLRDCFCKSNNMYLLLLKSIFLHLLSECFHIYFVFSPIDI